MNAPHHKVNLLLVDDMEQRILKLIDLGVGFEQKPRLQ